MKHQYKQRSDWLKHVEDANSLSRRETLTVLGAVGTGGYVAFNTDSDNGPDGDWNLVMHEGWETFDTDRWSVGFIDHEEHIPDDDSTVSADHVHVKDGNCVLEVESQGIGPEGCFQGVINSSVEGEDHHPDIGIPIDPSPGQYVEAKLKLPGRTGVLPAFWMHPANKNWPPEIDIIELFQDGRVNERRHVNFDVHWSASGQPNDRNTHEHAPFATNVGTDLTETFNTYGCAWYTDRIEWYFNGNHLLTRSSPPAMIQSLTATEARPFGLVFSNHVNRIGHADLSHVWTEELVIDWVRVWSLDD